MRGQTFLCVLAILAACGLVLFGRQLLAPKPIPPPVDGTVLLDGQPLAGATVVFWSRSETGTGVGKVTGKDGRFHLTRPSCASGIAAPSPGEYVVTVNRAGDPPLPEVYGNSAQTPFRCTLPTSGRLVFELRSKR
jgi:hypothetical protein